MKKTDGDTLKCNWCGGEHLSAPAGEACALFLRKLSRELKNRWVESEMILEAVERALDGETLSDFEESFPIVRKAQEAYWNSRII